MIAVLLLAGILMGCSSSSDAPGEAQDRPTPHQARDTPIASPERSESLEFEEEIIEVAPEEPRTPKEQVQELLEELGRKEDFACLDVIFQGESSWRPDAIGDEGESFGLGQRNAPAHGAPPWPWPIEDQLAWFLEYADQRYGGPCPASEIWMERAEARGGAGWW